MSPRDLVYVGHMLDTAKKAVSKTHGLPRETYDADENLRFALIHLIQIIGEAGRRVSREFCDEPTSIQRFSGQTSSACATRSCTATSKLMRTSFGKSSHRT